MGLHETIKRLKAYSEIGHNLFFLPQFRQFHGKMILAPGQEVKRNTLTRDILRYIME